jgi:serine/threonine-protein kinase
VGRNNFESALEAHEVLEEVLDIHKPRAAAPLAEPALPPATTALTEEGEPAMAEQLRRTDPGTRRPGALVEFRPEVKASPEDETVEVPRLLPAPALPDPREVRRSRRLVWIATALGVLALAEAVFIAGLIFGRPITTDAPIVLAAAPTPSQPAATPPAGPLAAPDSAGPNLTPPANAGFATIAPGSTSLADAALPQGRLEISSDPAGARVTIDGVRRGVTPLAVPVAVGAHTVVVSDGTSTATRTLTVAAGGTSTMIAALGPAGGAAGWLTISVPLELQIFEGESLLGATSAARLMLPAGTHELQLVNKEVGFQTKITVDVLAGKTANATVAVPNGSVSVNALPWANVWLDGRALGTTPIANLDVPLGTHEVIWRHPQFGERRQTVVVTTKAPVRLVMDLRK